MARVFFARGMRGEIARRLQRRLNDAGFGPLEVDGVFAGDTFEALKKFQTAKGLAATGEVDGDSWQALMGTPVPSVRDRALAVTGAFEGNDFTQAEGNFDGAGLTWGIIGFNLLSGTLQTILHAVQASHPELITQAFGPLAAQLLQVSTKSIAEQIAFADSISLGKTKEQIQAPWLAAFQAFGELPQVQAAQLDLADREFFQPALKTAQSLGLVTELGRALAFDIHVQNGGIRPEARAQIEAQLALHPVGNEQDKRVIVANAVADKTRTKDPKMRADVRARKLTLATGAGVVHGATYLLRNWGLADLPA
jgi:peptidoglycan hydrolase-like protein with peptidoglycan-binding domain